MLVVFHVSLRKSKNHGVLWLDLKEQLGPPLEIPVDGLLRTNRLGSLLWGAFLRLVDGAILCPPEDLLDCCDCPWGFDVIQ